jgi:hypothetical protein
LLSLNILGTGILLYGAVEDMVYDQQVWYFYIPIDGIPSIQLAQQARFIGVSAECNCPIIGPLNDPGTDSVQGIQS